jgi:hypothetical protein
MPLACCGLHNGSFDHADDTPNSAWVLQEMDPTVWFEILSHLAIPFPSHANAFHIHPPPQHHAQCYMPCTLR